VGFAAPLQAPLPNILGLFVAAIGIMTMLLFRFGTSLREALADALAREQELDRLRQELETAVSERTAILQATVDQLQASQATIRAIGAPILPVLPGVLVAPLMGVLDRERADVLSTKLLQEVQEQRAHAVIIDITGMLMVDTQIVEAILRMGSAIRLLGARVFVVGIRAEVAQTLVALDIDLHAIATFQNLQGAIQELIAQANAAALPQANGQLRIQ
jgi:anti-anti-sigma regulatory factor